VSRNNSFAAIAVLVVALDQVTKALVSARMTLGESIPLIDGLLSFTYIRNTGIAFGMFNDGTGGLKMAILTATTVLALGFLIWLLGDLSPRDRIGGAALGLVAGGAIGNLVDRLRLGEVVDFIDVYWRTHHWPFFNAADSAITVGVTALLVREVFFRPKHPEESAPGGEGTVAPDSH
jgi:signal peptidase II